MDTNNPLSKIKFDNTSGSSAILSQIINYLTDPANEKEWEDHVRNTVEFGQKEFKHFQVVRHFIKSLEENLWKFHSGKDLRSWISDYENYWSSLPDKWTDILDGLLKTKVVSISIHSQSESVKSVLYNLHKSGRKLKIFQSQSGPVNEGELQAVWLTNKGMEVTLITDALAPGFVARSDLVLLGCDGVYEDGFVNKAGSLALCLAAREFEKPAYILADSRKISHDTALKESPRSTSEITARSHPNLEVLNLYFELIPHSLITGYITEKGVLEENN